MPGHKNKPGFQYLCVCIVLILCPEMFYLLTTKTKCTAVALIQTQCVWLEGLLTGGESCSTGQVDSGQQSALKTGTLRTPLSSAHTLAIPRESEYQMYCCYLAFSLVCYTWPPTVTGWTVLGRGISLSLCFPPQCTLPTHETNGKRPLVPVNPAVYLRSGQSCR